MEYLRRSAGQMILFALALASIGISIYLTIVHYNTAVPLVCSGGGLINCEHVLTSRYSYVPGTTLPVSLPGILWSGIAALLAGGAWFIWPRQRLLLIGELIWSAIGLLTVLYLVYVEIVLLHTICAWCTAVHMLVLLFFIISLLLWQSDGTDGEDEDEELKEASILTSQSHSK